MKLAIDDDVLFNELESVKWKCLNCGHIIVNKNALNECPVCKHP